MTPFKIISRNILIMNDDLIEKIANTEPFGEQDNVDSPVRIFWGLPAIKDAPEIRRRILSAIASEQMEIPANVTVIGHPSNPTPYDPDKASKFKVGRQGHHKDYSEEITTVKHSRKDLLIYRLCALQGCISLRIKDGSVIGQHLISEYNELITTLWPNEKKDVNEDKG